MLKESIIEFVEPLSSEDKAELSADLREQDLAAAVKFLDRKANIVGDKFIQR